MPFLLLVDRKLGHGRDVRALDDWYLDFPTAP